MHLRIFILVLSLLTIPASFSNAQDFTLQEELEHSWQNECVTFPLTTDQLSKAKRGLALLDTRGKTVPYQVMSGSDQNAERICFQTDLAPLDKRQFRFSDQAATVNTDLKIQETKAGIVIENVSVGLAIRKSLDKGLGPIARIRLRSGKWTGGSTLLKTPDIKSYSAEVTAQGPVFVEVLSRVDFADEGTWSLRFRIERGEPVVLVEESFDAPGGGAFEVRLSGESYLPTHLFYRSGEGGTMGRVFSKPMAPGRVFLLEPWLHWWGSDRQGNWLGVYTAAPEKQPSIDLPKKSAADDILALEKKPVPDPHPDMLMIGLLRPSVWKDPKWAGNASHVNLNVPVVLENSQVSVSFPLGGGKRVWMLGTPDKTKSISLLTEKNRNVAPLPQRYLIKHGDFPLDTVKDYVLNWEGDHENYPRLFVGKKELKAMQGSLQSNSRELKRWESEQPIDKYNIGGPLREYYASGSNQLGSNIVKRCTEWLHLVVHNDLLLQNSRVTLGVAPHSQAVMLLPTLNLTDAALGVDSLTPELRRKFLAHVALLGYVVNRDDYWSPARGFSANPNMTTTVAQYQVTVASLIPSHPMAKQWAERGLGTLRYQLDAWSDEDGGWLEAPHYAMVSFDHMLAAFIMASRAGFGNHLYEERVRKVAEWFAKISTPPDAHTDGFRHHPPIGNTYHGEGTGMFGILAGLWKERDPQFAAQMEWMCQQHGSPDLGLGWSFPAMTGYKDLLKTHGVTPQQPDYGSAWFRKTGVVLRNKMGTGRETYLHLIAGSNHEHYDVDSGSIVLWGKGRVLADDWGYIGQHAQKYHSLLSSSATGGNMRIEHFATQPSLDYVCGKKGAWQRQIALIKDKDPLGPNFFAIRDTHTAEAAATWRLWLTAQPDAEEARKKAPRFPAKGKTKGSVADLLDDINKEDANEKDQNAPVPPVNIHEQGVTVSGEDDVDFDIFIYQADKLELRKETGFQNMTVGKRDGKTGPMQLIQTSLTASLPARGAISLIVYPRLKTEAPPKVIWHSAGRIAEVVSNTGSDFVCLQEKSDFNPEHKTDEGTLSFQGYAGSAQLRKGKITLTLGAGGEIHAGDKMITGGTAMTRSFLR